MNKRKSMIILATLVAILALGPIFATQTFAGKGVPRVEITLTIADADDEEMTGNIEVCNESVGAVSLSSVVTTLFERTGKGKDKNFAVLGHDLADGFVLPDAGDGFAAQGDPLDCVVYPFTLEYDVTSADVRSLKYQIDILVTDNPGGNPFTDQDSIDIEED